MFRVPTVFIIGAGAGFDVDMPLGEKLSEIIGDKLQITFEAGQQNHGDKIIMDAMRKVAAASKEDANVYRRAAYDVAGGIVYSRSIDSYLRAHRHNKPLQVCGKLAIAKTILEHEKTSPLVVQRGHQFRDPKKVLGSWLGAFMYGLQERIVVNENLSEIFQNLTIVNFNYDRCVEHFLFHALQAWSLKGEAEVVELMKGLRIYHPYGTVGDLPWQSPDGIEFGGDADEFRLGKCAAGIRTFNEEVEDKAKVDEIKDVISTASRVIFLGFHFHTQNVELVHPRNVHSGAANRQAYATAFNRSDADLEIINGYIARFGGMNSVWVRKEWDCNGLFREFGTTWMG